MCIALQNRITIDKVLLLVTETIRAVYNNNIVTIVLTKSKEVDRIHLKMSFCVSSMSDYEQKHFLKWLKHAANLVVDL